MQDEFQDRIEEEISFIGSNGGATLEQDLLFGFFNSKSLKRVLIMLLITVITLVVNAVLIAQTDLVVEVEGKMQDFNSLKILIWVLLPFNFIVPIGLLYLVSGGKQGDRIRSLKGLKWIGVNIGLFKVSLALSIVLLVLSFIMSLTVAMVSPFGMLLIWFVLAIVGLFCWFLYIVLKEIDYVYDGFKQILNMNKESSSIGVPNLDRLYTFYILILVLSILGYFYNIISSMIFPNELNSMLGSNVTNYLTMIFNTVTLLLGLSLFKEYRNTVILKCRKQFAAKTEQGS